MGDLWYVVDARTGQVEAEIHAAPGPHNTIVSRDGSRVYLGPRNSRYLVVASDGTNQIVKGSVRSSRASGHSRSTRRVSSPTRPRRDSSASRCRASARVAYSTPFRSDFPWRHSLGTPSHGIALTPDGRTLAVIDVPNSYVHVYDVTRVPQHVADVRLTHSMKGRESPCGGDCGRAGWLQYGLDGRYLWVADDGDVISSATNRVVAYVPALANSRYLFELDWRDGRPVRTGGRSGIVPFS